MQRTETTKALIEYDRKGLLTVTMHEDAEVHLKDTLEMREAAYSFHKGEPHVALVITSQRTSATEETRKFSAQNMAHGRIAEAVVVSSLPVRLLGNFYLKFYKPLTPTRMFDTKEDALKWLNEKMEEARAEKTSSSQRNG